MLPFLPPVVVGLHVLFSAFWPQRILFFSTGQRRSFISGQLWHWVQVFVILLHALTTNHHHHQLWHWVQVLVLLLLALTINTYLVEELQATFNQSLPLLSVHVQRKIGWMMALAASGAAIFSSVCYIVSYAILGRFTNIDHENLTNEEREWHEMLKRKKKVTYKTALGDKVEWANQIKYKKERINGWTWLLPILLCTGACAVAVAGVFEPKLAVVVEPKGSIGRAIDSVLEKVSLYEKEMALIEKQAGMDCFHFATIKDVLSVNFNKRYNLLLQHTDKFFNRTREFIQPLKEMIASTRRQAFNDIGEAILGEETFEDIKNLKNIDLTYLPLVLLLPKAIQLLILIFGMLMMSCASCTMTIYVEPQKIVDAFGNICKFSFFYCILSQVAKKRVEFVLSLCRWRCLTFSPRSVFRSTACTSSTGSVSCTTLPVKRSCGASGSG